MPIDMILANKANIMIKKLFNILPALSEKGIFFERCLLDTTLSYPESGV